MHTYIQEARAIPFIGERLANKVYEIVSTGQLRRLENVDKEKERIIEMFKNIHGVGLVTAQQFYAQVGGLHILRQGAGEASCPNCSTLLNFSP